VREVCTDDIWNGSSCNVFESDQYAYNLGGDMLSSYASTDVIKTIYCSFIVFVIIKQLILIFIVISNS